MRKQCYKYVLLIFMVLSTSIILLAGCSNTTHSDSSMTPSNNSTLQNTVSSPEDSVKGFLEGVKINDFDKASSYMNDGESFFKYDTAEDEKLFKLIFSKTSFKIISSEVNNDSATVKTQITAPDLGKISDQIVNDFVGELEGALNGDSTDWGQTGEMITESLISYLSKSNLPYKTTTVDIDLMKEGNTGEWVVKPEKKLVTAFAGGINLPGFEPENKVNDSKAAEYADDESDTSEKAAEKESRNDEKAVDQQAPDKEIDSGNSSKTIKTEQRTIIIENESTSYETTQIDEELQKQLDDLFKKLEDMGN